LTTLLKRRLLTVILLTAMVGSALAHWIGDWKVGDRVEAFNSSWYKVTILEVGTGDHEGSYFVTYDGFNKYSNNWVQGKNIRPLPAEEVIPTTGPRVGKYLLRSHVGKSVIPQGELEIRSRGRYRVYLHNGKLLGEGTYEYIAKTTTVKWLTGVYADEKRGGKFEVARQGKSHYISLNRTTIGSNSTD